MALRGYQWILAVLCESELISLVFAILVRPLYNKINVNLKAVWYPRGAPRLPCNNTNIGLQSFILFPLWNDKSTCFVEGFCLSIKQGVRKNKYLLVIDKFHFISNIYKLKIIYILRVIHFFIHVGNDNFIHIHIFRIKESGSNIIFSFSITFCLFSIYLKIYNLIDEFKFPYIL